MRILNHVGDLASINIKSQGEITEVRDIVILVELDVTRLESMVM